MDVRWIFKGQIGNWQRYNSCTSANFQFDLWKSIGRPFWILQLNQKRNFKTKGHVQLHSLRYAAVRMFTKGWPHVIPFLKFSLEFCPSITHWVQLYRLFFLLLDMFWMLSHVKTNEDINLRPFVSFRGHARVLFNIQYIYVWLVVIPWMWIFFWR